MSGVHTMIGTTIHSRYKILCEVGQGGMAVVYKGTDLVLGRPVAIKVLHPHLSRKDEARARFAREARIIARLRHPNIVEVYDFSGESSEDAFIVQEFVTGRSLADFLDEFGPLLPEVAGLIVSNLARALHHAHEMGVVHRDVKPENIMVREDGVLKLMDFGIAHVVDMEHLTMTGAIVGSPAHMSPEQVDGRALDRRTDIFSLGTMFFQMSTGRLPFMAETASALLRAICEARLPDVRALVPYFPEDLYGVLRKMMARDREARYGTALEVAQEIERALNGLGFHSDLDEVRRFFLDPHKRMSEVRATLIGRRKARGMAYLEGKKFALALAEFDLVRNLDPSDQGATRLMDKARRSLRRKTTARILVLGGILIGLLTGGGIATYRAVSALVRQRPETAKVTTRALPGIPSRDPVQMLFIAPRHHVATLRHTPFTPSPVHQRATPRARSHNPHRKNNKPAREERVPVVVQANPPAVAIYLDGRFVGYGPEKVLSLSPGPHAIRLIHPKCDVCKDSTYRFVADPRKPPTGPLKLSIGYLDAILVVVAGQRLPVFVDGTLRGTTNKDLKIPMYRASPVKVWVSVRDPTGKTRRRRVTLAPGLRVTVDMKGGDASHAGVEGEL